MSLLTEIHDAYRKHLVLPKRDALAIDIVYSVIAANCRPGQWEPVWVILNGPPSCGKSEMLLPLMDNPMIVHRTRITPKSFVSGFRPEGKEDEDPSLAKELVGKVLLISDFSGILTLARKDLDMILGVLRSGYDARLDEQFGNIGHQKYKLKFNMIGVATPKIDMVLEDDAKLGTRFVVFRVGDIPDMDERLKATMAALDARGGKEERRSTLAGDLLPLFPRIQGVMADARGSIVSAGDQKLRVSMLSELVVLLRTTPLTNGQPVSTEHSKRLVQNVGNLIDSRALLDDRREWNASDTELIARIAFDTIPPMARTLFRRLLESERPLPMVNLSMIARDNDHLISKTLAQWLHQKTIVQTPGPHGIEFALSDTIRHYAEASGMSAAIASAPV